MFKRLICTLILSAVVVCAVSCGSSDDADTTVSQTEAVTDAAAVGGEYDSVATATEVLNEAMTKINDMTDGKLYEYPDMDAITFSTYFGYDFDFDDEGNPMYPAAYEMIEGYALRMPTASTDVMEIDVIKFKAGTEQANMKEICELRLTKIKNNYESNANYDTDGSKKKHVDAAQFNLYGTYAVIICAENNTEAFAAAETMLKAK